MPVSRLLKTWMRLLKIQTKRHRKDRNTGSATVLVPQRLEGKGKRAWWPYSSYADGNHKVLVWIMQVKVNECGVPRSLLLSSIMQEPGSCHRSLCKDALCCQEDPSADNDTNTVCNFKTVLSNPFYQSVRIYTCISLSYGVITWSLSNSTVFHILLSVT